MIKSIYWLGCAATVLLMGGILSADEGVSFRYKPSEKEKILYQTTMTVAQTQTIGEQKIKTTMKQTSVDSWVYEKSDKQGNFQFRTETQQLKVKLKIDPVGEYQFDSKATEQDGGTVLSEALNPIYDRLATAALTVSISPRGKVTAVSGQKELVEDLLKDNPFAAQLAGGANDEAAKLKVAELFISFGDKPVKPGDTWETEFEVDMQGIGKSKGKRIYTYVGPDKVGDVATAKFTVTMDLSLDIDIKANGTQIKGQLAIDKSEGTIQFDAKKGRLISMKRSYTIGGDYTISAANGASQAVDSTQTLTVERTLIEKPSK